MNTEDAERAMQALAAPLAWKLKVEATYEEWEGFDCNGKQKYAVWHTVFEKSHDRHWWAANNKAHGRYETAEQAKSACENHALTGIWP